MKVTEVRWRQMKADESRWKQLKADQAFIYLLLPSSEASSTFSSTTFISGFIYFHLTFIYLHLNAYFSQSSRLRLSIHLSIHLPSSTFIYIHLPSSTFIYLNLCSYTFICIHLHPSSFICLHLNLHQLNLPSYMKAEEGLHLKIVRCLWTHITSLYLVLWCSNKLSTL